MQSLRKSLLALVGLVVLAAAGYAADEYRTGGPLAGLKLPRFPTQYGEPAGFPGCMEELRVKNEKGYVSHSPDGMAPQEHLYPGSVEHWHAYFFKYLPIQPMFTKQSLLKNWLAKDLPGIDKQALENYAEPVYWVPRHWKPVHTQKFHRPVRVLRTKVGAPEIAVDCGTLEPGLYSLRVIGAVETKHTQRHRLPLYMRMTVNDGLDGGSHTYRIRGPYVDEFYAVAEFYFHAPEKRRYAAKIAVHEGSKVELLVHNIDLHDVLAGHERRAIKSKRTLTANIPVDAVVAPDTPERQARDASLWDAFPPINFHLSYTYGMNSNDGKSNWPRVGAGGLDAAQIKEEHGDWSWRIRGLGDAILVNKKLGLEYTLSDYRAGKSLPDPYPFKDWGAGVWTPPATEGEKPQNFWPVPAGLWRRMRNYRGDMTRKITNYRTKGDVEAGRDAALMLCRMAYDFPTITARNTMHAVVIQPGSWGRDHGCRRRNPQTGFLAGVEINNDYDMLFDLIVKDAGLAASVGRFIPWVKTPQDVVKLLDVYLVQTTAKRCLRYHTYSSNVPARILTPTINLGDHVFTQPWLDWLFSATFVYPLPPSGIQDLLISGNARNGMGYIASHYYAHGEQAAPQAMALANYIQHGGLAKYNLSDPKRYPKPLAACHWFIDSRTAGNYFPRIGDVCGPDKAYGHPLYKGKLEAQCAIGWRWSKDPKFAWPIAQSGNRKGWTDAEWAEIETAAATVKRAPWLENKSRAFSNWGGFLESGVESDDPRFRRSAMVRVGQGWGHHHDDTMDLQLYAHGYPMTVDGGQRPSYTKPGDRTTRTHNLVEVDGTSWLGHAWVNTLTDADGSRYLRARAEPPANHPDVKLYQRQVALIDADPGVPGGAGPNSYVFDVVRVAGGKMHTHSFHAMLEDELVSNVENRIGLDELTGDEAAYTGMFHRDVATLPQSSAGFAGVAPTVLQATWRMTRERQGRTARNEELMNKAIWDPESPRKYTRLHLLGQQGARVMTGFSHCTQWKYGWTNLFTQRRDEAGLESVFPAIIEPYAGKPFLETPALLPITANETDARRAVAVQVKTANGRRDILFADGRPDKQRGVGANRFAAEYAYVSTDDQGLRLATLTGGTLLATGEVSIKAAQRERSGAVVRVAYTDKSMTIDADWPAPHLANRVVEVGVPGHLTTYTLASAAKAAGGTRLGLTEGGDFYLSRVREVDAAKKLVYSTLAFTHNEKRPNPGVDKHWVASNEGRTKFWRAEYLGDIDGTNRYAFQLDGAVAVEDFGKTRGIRLWEYGVGDTVRQSTFVSLHRRRPGVYELNADVDVALALDAKSVQRSPDGQAWGPLAGKRAGKMLEFNIAAATLAKGRVYLRLER